MKAVLRIGILALCLAGLIVVACKGDSGTVEEAADRPLPPFVIPLSNPGFEDSGTQKDTWWCNEVDDDVSVCLDGPYHTHFGEITTGVSWASWWVENMPVEQMGAVTGRPEMNVVDLGAGFPDAERVHSGDRSQKAFTFYRPHYMGVAQRWCFPLITGPISEGWAPDCLTVYVRSRTTHGLKHNDFYFDDMELRVQPIATGLIFTLEAYVHSWFSSCSTKPHDPPLWPDCDTPAPWAHAYLSVGFDPTGGNIDPLSSEIVWSEEVEQYGTFGAPLELVYRTDHQYYMPIVHK